MTRLVNYLSIKKKITVALSAGGNADIGISKTRPLFGIFSDTSTAGGGITLLPYSVSTNSNWCVHAISAADSSIIASTSATITIYYGEPQN